MSNYNCPVTGAPVAEGHPCLYRASIDKQIDGWNKMSRDREMPGLRVAQTRLNGYASEMLTRGTMSEDYAQGLADAITVVEAGIIERGEKP